MRTGDGDGGGGRAAETSAVEIGGDRGRPHLALVVDVELHEDDRALRTRRQRGWLQSHPRRRRPPGRVAADETAAVQVGREAGVAAGAADLSHQHRAVLPPLGAARGAEQRLAARALLELELKSARSGEVGRDGTEVMTGAHSRGGRRLRAGRSRRGRGTRAAALQGRSREIAAHVLRLCGSESARATPSSSQPVHSGARHAARKLWGLIGTLCGGGRKGPSATFGMRSSRELTRPSKENSRTHAASSCRSCVVPRAHTAMR